jgi:hypothetical protein
VYSTKVDKEIHIPINFGHEFRPVANTLSQVPRVHEVERILSHCFVRFVQ